MQGTRKDISPPIRTGSFACVPSLVHFLPMGWTNYLMIFLMGVLKPKGYFLAKQKSLMLQMSLEMQVMCGRV